MSVSYFLARRNHIAGEIRFITKDVAKSALSMATAPASEAFVLVHIVLASVASPLFRHIAPHDG